MLIILCPKCGSSKIKELIFPKSRKVILHCKSCGLIFLLKNCSYRKEHDVYD